MNHDTLQKNFISWFQDINPDARIFINNSGKCRINKNLWIPYGMPSSGGGSDLIAFFPGGVCKFYEVKTLAYPTLSAKQIRWAELMTRLEFEYYIVQENDIYIEETRNFFKIIDFFSYKLKNN